MTRNFDDFIATLPLEEQTAIHEDAERLIAEELTLRELREELGCSQRELGEILDINQAAVSKLERRSDMRLSTLREFVQALGGELEISVKLPGKSPVRLKRL